jgi:hypothetical protein
LKKEMISMDVTQEPAERKTLAMIAHDGKKADMVAFATYNYPDTPASVQRAQCPHRHQRSHR